MADIRRKNVHDYPRLNNCRIKPEAFVVLNQIAGHRAMAAAIEDLVKFYLRQQGSTQQPALSNQS